MSQQEQVYFQNNPLKEQKQGLGQDDIQSSFVFPQPSSFISTLPSNANANANANANVNGHGGHINPNLNPNFNTTKSGMVENMTLNSIEQQLRDLQSENFDLRMSIYYIRDKHSKEINDLSAVRLEDLDAEHQLIEEENQELKNQLQQILVNYEQLENVVQEENQSKVEALERLNEVESERNQKEEVREYLEQEVNQLENQKVMKENEVLDLKE